VYWPIVYWPIVYSLIVNSLIVYSLIGRISQKPSRPVSGLFGLGSGRLAFSGRRQLRRAARST